MDRKQLLDFCIKHDILLKETGLKTLEENQLLICQNHTKRVMTCIEKLAEDHKLPLDQARLAAEYHDVGGIVPNHLRVAFCQAFGIEILKEEEAYPILLHQKISGLLAEHVFEIEDKQVLSAISCHTTLKARPSQMDCVMFLADKIEWDQRGIPPYKKDLLEALDESLEAACMVYIDYLLQDPNLKIAHPHLLGAKEDLESTMSFIQALKNFDLKAVKLHEKGEYHSHSGMGMRYDTFKKWCGCEVAKAPNKMQGIAGMDDYMFTTTKPHVDSREGFEFLLKATLEEAQRDGISILETSIDVFMSTYYDSLDDFIAYIKYMKSRFSFDFRPEIGVFKGLNEERFRDLVYPIIDSGIFQSIDLYGDESIYQKDLFKSCFDYCRGKNIKRKIHIGEFSGPESIRQIIVDLDPDEIQHGIGAADDQAVMDLIKEKDIRLHVCPTSNVVLGAVDSLKDHPIARLFHAGIRLTINSDDLLFFHQSVSEEYLNLYKSDVLSAEDLNKIRLESLRH